MTYIVAEISGNHGGRLANALELIAQAKWSGADAVKFQCFDPARLAEKRSKNPEVLALAGGKPLLDLYRSVHTPRKWFSRMISYATLVGIDWFSSVFDPQDVDFLKTFNCPKYKISAFEMLDWELIKAVKETGKPIILSVRPTKDVTILQASDYEGVYRPLGISDHSCRVPSTRTPMIEWHLKLQDVETPDSKFSVTSDQLKEMIAKVRKRDS